MSLPLSLTRYFSIPLISKVFLIILLVLSAPRVGAGSVVLPRNVLVVYNAQHNLTPTKNPIVFRAFETVLGYHGLLPEYCDVSGGALPDAQEMQAYRGVITVLEAAELPHVSNYFSWLIEQLRAGKKVIVLGAIGGSVEQQAVPVIKKKRDMVLERLGLRYSGESFTDRTILRYGYKDTKMVEFERSYGQFPPYYEKYTAVNDLVTTHLSVRLDGVPGSESPVIVTGPAGGLALDGFVYWHDPATHHQQWYVNPFFFVQKSFGLQGLPKPDPTTLNGRRVAISHIDGDGFADVSNIDKQLTSAEIIRDRILEKYNFPTAVSVIVGQIDPQIRGSEKLVTLARDIFSLPKVEVASHSYSHPTCWDSGNGESHPAEARTSIEIPGYSYDPKMEIDTSIQYVSEKLAPAEKPCTLFFWTGDSLPLEPDIARSDALGVLNMNGGETVVDAYSTSFTSVSPLYRKVGERYQIHVGMASEDLLTNHWTEPLYGYRSIITTAQRTGSPFRLKPIDIYFHFYSGTHHASLRAVQDVYEWVLAQPVAPAYTSEYIRMVQGFLAATLQADGPDRFIVSGYGDCLTVRFDDEQRVPDLARSENVLGFSRQEQGLYVSLVPGGTQAILVMTNAPAKDVQPYIQEAAGWITDFSADEKHLRLSYKGSGKGMVALGGLPPNQAYGVSGSALSVPGDTLTSTLDGFLTVAGITSGNLEMVRL